MKQQWTEFSHYSAVKSSHFIWELVAKVALLYLLFLCLQICSGKTWRRRRMALVEVIQTESGKKTSSPTHLRLAVEDTGSH